MRKSGTIHRSITGPSDARVVVYCNGSKWVRLSTNKGIWGNKRESEDQEEGKMYDLALRLMNSL